VLLLLPVLRNGPKRNGELMRAIEGVPQKDAHPNAAWPRAVRNRDASLL